MWVVLDLNRFSYGYFTLPKCPIKITTPPKKKYQKETYKRNLNICRHTNTLTIPSPSSPKTPKETATRETTNPRGQARVPKHFGNVARRPPWSGNFLPFLVPKKSWFFVSFHVSWFRVPFGIEKKCLGNLILLKQQINCYVFRKMLKVSLAIESLRMQEKTHTTKKTDDWRHGFFGRVKGVWSERCLSPKSICCHKFLKAFLISPPSFFFKGVPKKQTQGTVPFIGTSYSCWL